MTRNCENDSTSRPGNSSSRWARITLVSSTKACCPAQSSSGSLITRGSTRGTLTIAIVFSRPKASRPPRRAMKLSDFVGDLRERMRRVQPHRHQQRPHLVARRTCRPSGAAPRRAAAWFKTTMPSRSSAGIISSLSSAYCSSISSRALAATASRLRIDAPVPELARRLQIVGKANLEEFVEVGRDDGDVAQPLEQRHIGAIGLRQHAPVEFEDRRARG